MKFEVKALSVALLIASLSAPVSAAVPVTTIDIDFSGLFSRGNVFSDTNNSVEFILGAGVNHTLSQIDFSAFVSANDELLLGTTFGDLSVAVRYQDTTIDVAENVGFLVNDLNFIAFVPNSDAISGSLQDGDGLTKNFGWHIKEGGTLTFSFNELYDDAQFDDLSGADYWDAQWQTGSTLSLVAVPVPEPETYAMMLAGLGLVAFAARRRKSMK